MYSQQWCDSNIGIINKTHLRNIQNSTRNLGQNGFYGLKNERQQSTWCWQQRYQERVSEELVELKPCRWSKCGLWSVLGVVRELIQVWDSHLSVTASQHLLSSPFSLQTTVQGSSQPSSLPGLPPLFPSQLPTTTPHLLMHLCCLFAPLPPATTENISETWGEAWICYNTKYCDFI